MELDFKSISSSQRKCDCSIMGLTHRKEVYTLNDTKLMKEYKEALSEKKQIFRDMELSFPKEIETQYYEAIFDPERKRNPFIVLDQLCHSYIDYALENYAEIKYKELHEKCKRTEVTDRELKKLIGKYGTKELIKNGYLSFVKSYYGNKIYTI